MKKNYGTYLGHIGTYLGIFGTYWHIFVANIWWLSKMKQFNTHLHSFATHHVMTFDLKFDKKSPHVVIAKKLGENCKKRSLNIWRKYLAYNSTQACVKKYRQLRIEDEDCKNKLRIEDCNSEYQTWARTDSNQFELIIPTQIIQLTNGLDELSLALSTEV